MQLALVLHNIRSVHNVGSIFRTADAAGVQKIILTGYTPTPLDRFGRPRTDLSKVALGAEKTVDWEYVKNPSAAIKKLKQDGFEVVALEQDARAASLFNFKAKSKTALLLGNEVRGISGALRAQCDAVVEIPMHGSKESLNVAVAAGVALFTLLQ